MQVLFFPGLGADWRLFKPQLDASDVLMVPEWLEAKEGESLQDYVNRYAPVLAKLYGDDLIIGGMSFGGQVALELARVMNPRAVFLISSHRSGSEVSPFFKMQERASRNMPDSLLFSGIQKLGIPMVARKEKLDDKHCQLLNQMTESMDLSFFRKASRMTAEWDYEFKREDFKMPIFHIHGEGDEIIAPPKDTKSADVTLLPDAKHLITYTHHQRVSRWIQEKLTVAS
jgi:pimeloyl-ACP methyl ester carboxylesterase